MSVDLPAPFSPSRACTSPRRRSKSTRSFATTAPNRLVTPRSSRAGRVSLRGLLHRVGNVRDLARGDLLLDLVEVGLVLLGVGRHPAHADAARLQVEDGVGSRLELAVLDVLRRLEDRVVDLLERRGEHLVAQVELVGVDPDPLGALLLGGVERAEPGLAGDLEDDLRAVGDLVEAELLA